MEKWKSWLWFNFKSSFRLPSKGILVKITSTLRHQAKENKHGLVNLYNDMEACAGYADIQVMWEMIHSTRPSNARNTQSSKKPSHWRFCRRPI
ncbi:unnamed protein product [Ilex paraguariensis]|uniref:Uncharacterized protein n=1 Tax=Ilex paraguariensis TaxID=185542 RepID=A0ABC8UQ77_9AQUA